jgi:hypothetical protein
MAQLLAFEWRRMRSLRETWVLLALLAAASPLCCRSCRCCR